MSTGATKQAATEASAEARAAKAGGGLAFVLRTLSSVRFAVGLVIVIAVVCVVGTLLPQSADATAYIEKSSNRTAAGLLAMLRSLGFTHVFHSWWFIGLLCVLASSVATCSARRFATVRRTVGGVRLRAIGSMLTHISILLILAGAVLRAGWGEIGVIELREGETKAEFTTERGMATLPFAVRLSSFDIETYSAPKTEPAGPDPTQHLTVQWPARHLSARVPVRVGEAFSLTPMGEKASPENTFVVRILRYLPDLRIGESGSTGTPKNPALLVQVDGPNYSNHRWVSALWPDQIVHAESAHPTTPGPLRFLYAPSAGERAPSGPVKSFKSTVEVVKDGSAIPAVVEVNRPLKVNGYTFYQASYNPDDLAWTALEVRRDPGVPLVYAGFALIIAGLFTVFYLNPWLELRKARA
jgi:hypothetical protein